MASGGVPELLALEIAKAGRAAADRSRPARSDPTNEQREPVVGRSRIHGELLKLGFELAESTVSTYMIRRRHPPSQSWRTFLRNHAEAIAAIDLCLVPTVRFERLFALVVIGHGRRQLLWFAVTRHPTAEWLAQQIIEAFRGRRLQPIWCATMMVRTARSSSGGFGRWGSETDRYHRDRPGRTHIGTSDRNTPARLPGSRCHLRRAASASGPDRVFLLLQSDANAFVFVQGCAARSIDPARGSDCAAPILSGLHHCYSRI